MTPEIASTILQKAIETAMLLGAPMLISGLVVGLLISVFQAATQINEMTLTFIPKVLVMLAVLVLAGPWMLGVIVDYTIRLFTSIPSMIG